MQAPAMVDDPDVVEEPPPAALEDSEDAPPSGAPAASLEELLESADEADELDSYCFQTVGHSVVEAYAECMGVPLHRRAIARDSSKNQRMVYERTDDDEVEELHALLAEVQRQQPEVEAVSSSPLGET